MKKAFTIIELLVTIAIIAILIGIIMPVFGKAKESARQGLCLSNLRTFGTSIASYRIDYGYIPFAPDRYDLRQEKTELLDSLIGYIDAAWPRIDKNDEIIVDYPFYCPLDYAFATATGMSYEYVAGSFLADYGMSEYPNPDLLREVTFMYDEDYRLPLMQDLGHWHMRAKGPNKQAAYMDGHAGWTKSGIR